MKKYKIILAGLILAFHGSTLFAEVNMNSIELSRKSCVEITSKSGNSKASGFFIDKDLVATCFHAVASITQSGKNINWEIFQDIKIKTIEGETINAQCVSIPVQTDLSPLTKDFAILKLAKTPSNITNYILNFSDIDVKNLEIGSDCYFSGYPLSTPGLITHKGMISGTDSSGNIICIQGSINKGNSGGALLSNEGKVLGIISMREGGISKALEDLVIYINATSKQGSVQLMGVDPLQAIKVTVETLNTYISTGIGYAINIKFLEEYIIKNKLLNTN